MYVSVQHGLQPPQRIEASQVIVFDDAGNPVSLTMQLGGGAFVTSNLGDPDWHIVLRNLGMAVCVSALETRPLHTIRDNEFVK